MTSTEIKLEGPFLRMLRGAREVELKLGLSEGYILEASASSDDWTFVLKLHGVLDAALEGAIRERCFHDRYGPFPRDEAALEKICSALSFDGRVSKLSFATTFAIVDGEGLKFARALNRARNLYAHRLRNFKVTLREVANQSGNAEHLIADLVAVPQEILGDPDGAALRFLIGLRAMSVLWQVEFRAIPPPTILGSLLDEWVAHRPEN